jgi:hypothetical protein
MKLFGVDLLVFKPRFARSRRCVLLFYAGCFYTLAARVLILSESSFSRPRAICGARKKEARRVAARNRP